MAPEAAPAPEDSYRDLSVSAVLADLASLSSEQLLLVKTLEEQGDRRPVILDRIEDLLVVQEATHHVRQATSTPAPAVAPTPPPPPPATPPLPPATAPLPPATAPLPPATPVPTAPPLSAPAPTAAVPTTAPPALPGKPVSSDLVDQMGGLLAKHAARRSLDAPTTQTFPEAGRLPPPPTGAAPVAPNGVIVAKHGRSWHRGRVAKVLVILVILALLGGAGGVIWQQTHKTKSKATSPAPAAATQPAGDPVAALLTKAVPAGFVQQPDSVGDTGPSNLAKAVSDDGATGAQAALVQDGFVHGYQRMWSNAGDQQDAVVFLYQFQTARGAGAYGQRMVAQTKAGPPVPSTFSVVGLPGATGLRAEITGTQSAQIVYSKGDYLVGVQTTGPTIASVVLLAQQVAASQYAALPAT